MTEDVVIAGGGPNGLMLACELGLAGVRPVVLERLAAPVAEDRANGLVGQVVRLLDQRGLYERFGGGPGAPRPAPYYVFGAFPLDLTRLDPNPVHTLPIPQRRMERLLAERADELGVEIRRGHELAGLQQDGDGVSLDVRGPDGPYPLRARYLVGCDGGRSTVRTLSGIGFPGVTATGLVSRTAHVTLPEPLLVPSTGELDVPGYGRIAPFLFTRTERGVFVFARFEPGRHVVSTIEWDQPDSAADAMTLGELRASVRRVLGADLPLEPPDGPGPHLLRRLAGGNTRLAERYRDGRVLLAGDAAHVHSAIGGPGLNLGLQDAANLGWKLAATVRGRAAPGLLDTYGSERRPVGERVFTHSLAQTALMAPGPGVTAVRALFGELLERPDNVRHIAELIAGSDVRYATSCDHPLAGRFVPDLALTTDAGPVRLAELMRAARPVLLTLGGPVLRDTAAPWRDRLTTVTATCADAPADALLVRPDGYVAWAATGDRDPETLREALTTWLGPA